MGSTDPNPYQSSPMPADGVDPAPAPRRWPSMVALVACGYYATSVLTLPFAAGVWYGEVPVLALFQIPKSFLKWVFQDLLLWLVHLLGLSRGSPSPDYIATHDPALALAMALPAVGLVLTLLLTKHVSNRGRWITAVVLCAALDAVVTFWFDNAFSLKLFNSIYF